MKINTTLQTPEETAAAPGTISVRDIVDGLDAAYHKMSATNSHRPLLMQAVHALVELHVRLEAAMARNAEMAEQLANKPRVELATAILPGRPS